MQKNIITALTIAAIALSISLIVWVSVDIQNKVRETENTIIVSDTGEVYTKPDLAITTFSVITEEKTVVEAMTKNTEKMNAIIAFMKEQLIEDKDLKTISFNVYPRYEWRERTAIYPSGKRVLAGYEVRQALQVKIRDMKKIGEIIEGATESGANQTGDLQFTVDKQDELKKQAREQAIEKAKTKAKNLASQLGVKLVRITNFHESSVIPRYYGLEKAAISDEQGAQIEAGENKIAVTVTITYEIR